MKVLLNQTLSKETEVYKLFFLDYMLAGNDLV